MPVAVIGAVVGGQPAVHVAVTVYSVKLAAVTGRRARNVVSLPSAWSGAIFAGKVWPWKEMSTCVADEGTKPHIIACLGAAARMELGPEATAKRKGGGGGGVAATADSRVSAQKAGNMFDINQFQF